MKKFLCILMSAVCILAVSCDKNEKTQQPDTGNTAGTSDVAKTSGTTDTSDTTGGENQVGASAENVPEKGKNEAPGQSDVKETLYPVMMFMADGHLWYDTGENSMMTPRCGTLDGILDTVCGEYEVPKKDGTANFKAENPAYFGWQNASEDTKEVNLAGGWRIFKRVELLQHDAQDFSGCVRADGDNERIILTVNKIEKDAQGNNVYTSSQKGEVHQDLEIPIKYGCVYDWGIVMYAENIHPCGMTLNIKTEKKDLPDGPGTGSDYWLEVYNGKFWESVPYTTDNYAWDMVMYLIPADGAYSQNIDWEWLYGELPAGKYRISKRITDNNPGKITWHTYYLEFDIENDVITESTCPYALLYDGVMYYYTGEYVFDKVEYTEDDVLGSVTSTIPETRMPSVDCQANVEIEGSIFMRHELSGDGLLVLIDDKWYIFERRDNSTEPETIGAEGTDSYTVGTADNWSVWECGAVFGANDSVGINHWIVDQTHDGISTTSIVPDLDGEYYCSFGLRKNRSKSGDFVECKTFRVVSNGGQLVEAEEIEALTKQTILEKGVPFSGKLDGSYYCETRRGADYDAHTITHSLTVGDGRIKLYSYVKSTCGGGCYEGDFKYSDTDGTLTADIVYTATSEGDVFTKDFKIEGKLLEYGGFVHFVLTDCEPEAFHLTTEDPFPMSFRIS